jgi:hypothetical protein
MYYPMMLQAQFFLKSVEIELAAGVFVKIFKLFKHTHEHYALVSLFEAVEAFYYGTMNEKVVECLQLARNNFIGDLEDFKHICANRFLDIEDFSSFMKFF